jgi:hypothetical protein
MAKRLAAHVIPGTVTWDLSDSASGFVRAARIYNHNFQMITSDTFIVFYDDAAKDSIFGNERVIVQYGSTAYPFQGRQLYFWLADTDTNGFFDTAQSAMAYNSGEVVFAEGNSGNDNNFTDINKIRIPYIKYFQIWGTDTLFVYELFDDDGDGTAISTTADSSLIRLEYTKYNTILTAILPVREEVTFWAGIYQTPSTRLMPRKAIGASYYESGKKEQFRIAGTTPDSIIAAGDTALVNITSFIPRIQGGADTATLDYEVLCASALENINQYGLLSMAYKSTSPADSVSYIALAFDADPPLTLLSTQITGTLSGSVVFDNGQSASLTAILAPELITVTLVGVEGETAELVFDYEGNLIN